MRNTFRGTVAALTFAALSAGAPCVAAPAGAQPLTFDDRPVGQAVTPFTQSGDPTTYGGLEFAGFFVGSNATPGTGAGAASGTRFAFVGNGLGFGEIYSPTSTFNFLSGFLGVRSTGTLAGPAVVTLRGFDVLGAEVFTQALTLSTTSTFFSFSTPLIDAIEFDTSALDANPTAGAVVVLDNLTVSTVPEPGTVVLLATGLVAVGAVARLRRRRA